MELLAKVIEVGQLNSRSYNDRQGQQQTITSRQVMLKRGEDTFYAEATGDRAVNMDTNLAGDLQQRGALLGFVLCQRDVLQRELGCLFVNQLVCLIVNDGAVFYRDVLYTV